MFGDINALKAQMEEQQQKLAQLEVEHSSREFTFKCRANNTIQEIVLPENFQTMDKEELEDYLVLGLNEVLAKAKVLHDSEMQKMAGSILPGFPGM